MSNYKLSDFRIGTRFKSIGSQPASSCCGNVKDPIYVVVWVDHANAPEYELYWITKDCKSPQYVNEPPDTPLHCNANSLEALNSDDIEIIPEPQESYSLSKRIADAVAEIQ